MAIPALPFLLKFLVVKVVKGAAVGFVRFVRRVINKSKSDEEGSSRSTDEQLKHAVEREWHRKENMVYLFLMLSNAIYGAQELCVWVWQFVAKRCFDQYCAAVPAGFELPETFCDRLHNAPRKQLFVECSIWIGMASLVYWPLTHEQIEVVAADDEQWIEIRWKRLVYLIKIDTKRRVLYRGMDISIDVKGGVEVITKCGQSIKYSATQSK